jgi:DtxR family Mn-dependent transcriptional regulator
MLKTHESAENYLETILVLTQRNTNVRSIDIVNELNFSKPSVSVAMKNLRENGCIRMDGAGYITLTEKGQQIAEMIYERHRILSQFLESLGVSAENAAEDACRIEHVISKESFDALKRHMQALDAGKKEA